MVVRNRVIILGCLVVLVALTTLSLCIGRYPIHLTQLWEMITNGYFDENLNIVLLQIRLPRIIGAIVIGGALSLAGTAYQGMFRNPMVSPDILGVTSGAGFGAALAIIFSMPVLGIQVFSFIGGIAAVIIAIGISSMVGKSHDVILVLVLAGIIISSLFSAFLSILKYMADPDDKLPAITYWLMGSLASVSLSDIYVILPIVILGSIPIVLVSWQLNVLSFGEDEARSLGVNTKAIRILVISCASLITASIVSISGIIGWVGLVIPHFARLAVGPNHRVLLPVSFLFGGIFLLLVDNLARSISSVELPIGILTSVIGAPFFVYFLKKSSKRSW